MSETEVAQNATYRSAERVLTLLKSFDDSRTELGVADIARALSVHKSTASRLAAALERTGFLTRVDKRYRRGVEIIRLGTLALRSFDLVATMQPAMEKLSQRTGETVNLAVPDGGDVLNVAEVPSTYILSCSGGWIGRRTKPHAVANGKVLLAYGAVPMPRALERYTDRTVASPDALAQEMAQIQRDGYATAVAELEEELVAVAAPVFNPAGACVAALSVSGPAYRMPHDKLDELGALCAGSAGARPARGPGAPSPAQVPVRRHTGRPRGQTTGKTLNRLLNGGAG